MIYITGDTHGQFERRFTTGSFPEQKDMTKSDYVIICGDFGGIWDRAGESDSEKHWLDWFNDRSYTLLFIDGNHENFDRIESYPEKEWHGAEYMRLDHMYIISCEDKCLKLTGKRFLHLVEPPVMIYPAGSLI